MLTKLPAQNKIAAFDIDAQNTFTPVCPDELPGCRRRPDR